MLLRPRLPVSRVREALALVSLLVGSVAPAVAQNCDTTTTAAVLKRLGEAVDGYRIGRPVWVVASLTGTPNVLGVFPNAESAQRLLATNACNHVYGPFGTSTDGTKPMSRRIASRTTMAAKAALMGPRQPEPGPPRRPGIAGDRTGRDQARDATAWPGRTP